METGQQEALKADYVQGLISSTTSDYHDTNIWQKNFAYWIGYGMQLISVGAFAYLLYEVFCFVWAIQKDMVAQLILFGVALAVGTGIEYFRRMLIESEGVRLINCIIIKPSPTQKHYVFTGKASVGKVLTLLFMSAFMIAMSAGGAWVFVQKNAPQKAQVKVQEVASPLQQDIKAEKERVSALDKSIQDLQKSKANELKDHKSYAVWEGKEYLLPETKVRHEGYDRQIATMHAQRQKHLELIDKYEGKLTKTETKVEAQNAGIQSENASNLYWYGIAAALIWVFFELILLWALCYPFVFEQEVRKEKLGEIVAHGFAPQYLTLLETQKQKRAYETFRNVAAIAAPTQMQMFPQMSATFDATLNQTNPIGFQGNFNSKPKRNKPNLEALYQYMLSGKPINRQTLSNYGFGVNIHYLNAMENALLGKGHKVNAKMQNEINAFVLSKGGTIALPAQKISLIHTEF